MESKWFHDIYTAIWVFTVFFLLSTECQTSDGNIITASFNMYNGVSRPSSVSGCLTARSKSKVGCVGVCTRNTSCYSVFAEQSNGSDSSSWMCLLCGIVWGASDFTSGYGYCAVSKFGARDAIPTVISSADLDKVEVVNNIMTATYICRVNVFPFVQPYFKLAYDTVNNKWPDLNALCQISICNTQSIRGQLNELIYDPAVLSYHFTPICRQDERAITTVNAQILSNGIVVEAIPLYKMCISSSCIRRNSLNRAIYQGHVNTTVNNRQCQRWDQQLPHLHTIAAIFMYEDEGSLEQAENYCRDPIRNGFVWCYTTDLMKRWEECDVPDCD